jgi:endoglucanase
VRERIEARKDAMNLNEKWLSSLFAVAALGAVACGPAPTDPAIEQTLEGSPCPASALIDDGEDNNNQVMVQDGRSGYWYTYVDKEGSTIDPPAGETGGIFAFAQGGVNGSAYAARMAGSIGKANIVYAGMGCNLSDPKGPFDASKYGGVSFWAKRGANTTPKVRFKMPDGATDPDGGICSACFNDFGMELKLTEEWTKYVLLFDRMKQERGWGSPHPSGIDSAQLFGIQFQVNDKGQPYDVWVDDLGFTGCGGSGAAPAAATPAATPAQ